MSDFRYALFNETQKYVFPTECRDAKESDNRILAASAVRNLQTIGFTVSGELFEKLASLDKESLVNVYKDLYATCMKKIGGGFHESELFYPNFPDEVMNMSELELYLNAFVYYTGQSVFGVDLIEHAVPDTRMDLLSSFERKLKVVNLGTEQDIDELMKGRLFSIKSLPEAKMEELCKWMKENTKWMDWVHDASIPNKENRAKISVWAYNNIKDITLLTQLMPDAVDVLRFAALLSNKEIEKKNIEKGYNKKDKYERYHAQKIIPENSVMLDGTLHFYLSSEEKRLVKDLLNNCKNLYVDIWRKEAQFKALSKMIKTDACHAPARVARVFDNLWNHRKDLENGQKISTEGYLYVCAKEEVKEGELTAATELAKRYPGVFNRKFLSLINESNSVKTQEKICDLYGKYAHLIPPAEILKTMNTAKLNTARDTKLIHSVYKKGTTVSDRFVREKAVANYEKSILNRIEESCKKAFHNAVSENKSLGKVYVDKALTNNKLPENSDRDASEGANLTFGSRIKTYPEANIKRAWIRWSEDCDIDTNTVFLDKDFNKIGECAYYELKGHIGDTIVAALSGDWTHKPANADYVAECIDLDTDKLKQCGCKYVLFGCHGFTSAKFKDINGGVQFGLMQREGTLDMQLSRDLYKTPDYYLNFPVIQENKNRIQEKVYEPATVDFCVNIRANGYASTPIVFDVENEEIIWIDKPIRCETYLNAPALATDEYISNVYGYLKMALENPTADMYTYFSEYAKATSEITEDITEADTVFLSTPSDAKELGLKENAKVITAYDLSTITSDFMAQKKPEKRVEKTQSKEKKKRVKEEGLEL